MMKEEEKLYTKELYDLSHTAAAPLLEGTTYPWEALPQIGAFIRELGAGLSLEEYDHPQEDVWIHKTAKIYPNNFIAGPCVIGAGTEVRPGAFIRGNALVGENCVVGNSTEPCWPCGACRQMLYEFAPDLTLLVARKDHSFVKLTLGELMPHGFGPKGMD